MKITSDQTIPLFELLIGARERNEAEFELLNSLGELSGAEDPLPRLAFFGDHSKKHDKQIKSTTTTILMSKDLKVGEGPLIWSEKERNGKESKLDAHWIRSAKLLWVGSKGECMVHFQT